MQSIRRSLIKVKVKLIVIVSKIHRRFLELEWLLEVQQVEIVGVGKWNCLGRKMGVLVLGYLAKDKFLIIKETNKLKLKYLKKNNLKHKYKNQRSNPKKYKCSQSQLQV